MASGLQCKMLLTLPSGVSLQISRALLPLPVHSCTYLSTMMERIYSIARYLTSTGCFSPSTCHWTICFKNSMTMHMRLQDKITCTDTGCAEWLGGKKHSFKDTVNYLSNHPDMLRVSSWCQNTIYLL